MSKIKIGKKNYNVKYTLRALFVFERIAKHPFEITSMLDNYILLYSVLLANNPEMELTWDEFIDEMDKDPELFIKMNKAIDQEQAKNKVFADDDKQKGDKEQKKE